MRRSKADVEDQLERLGFLVAVTEDEMAYSVVRGWIAALRWALGREDVAEAPAGVADREAVAANLARLDGLNEGDWIEMPLHGAPEQSLRLKVVGLCEHSVTVQASMLYRPFQLLWTLIYAAAHAPGFVVVPAADRSDAGGEAE